jgi:hypothetical protein
MPPQPDDPGHAIPLPDQEEVAVKSLKISLLATVAATAAWFLRIPQAIWPAHPLIADSLLAFVGCVLLQVAWTNAKKEPS